MSVNLFSPIVLESRRRNYQLRNIELMITKYSRSQLSSDKSLAEGLTPELSAEENEYRKELGDEEAIGRLVEEEIQLRRYGMINRGKNVAEQQNMLHLWEEDTLTLKFLQESLKRNEDLTKKMVTILDSFDARLTSTLDSINLIYDEIFKHQTKLNDIDDTMTKISDVLAVCDAVNKDDEGGLIKSDNPFRNGVAAFLSADDSITKATKFIEGHMAMVGAADRLTLLRHCTKEGDKKLLDHFVQVLQKNSQRISLKEYLDQSRGVVGKKEFLGVSFIEPDTCRDLGFMATRLSAKGNESHLSHYITTRSRFLRTTILSHFGFPIDEREEQQGNHSEYVSSDGDSKKDKNVKSEMISYEDFLSPDKDGKSYSRGQHNFLRFIDCFLLLLSGEWNVAKSVLRASKDENSPDWEITFRLCVEPTICQMFRDVGNKLFEIQRKNADRVYSSAVLLDTWGYILEHKLIDKYTKNILKKLNKYENVINEFNEKLVKEVQDAFVKFENDVKDDPLKPLPSDGTVHPLTSNTITYLLHLFEFRSEAVALLPAYDTNENKLSSYIMRVLENLIQNLENKARKDKTSQALSNIFRLNNFYFISKKVSTTSLGEVINQSSINFFENTFEKEYDLYMDSWGKAKAYLEDDWQPSGGLKGKVTTAITRSKPNQVIKDRFSGFNSEIKELFESQQRFFISDETLRQTMREAIVTLICKDYRTIYEKYFITIVYFKLMKISQN
eukprot:TRINITY_DN2138_c0_g1_i1.p1 TRINITY_DN2138_c0_g1~~TRINITY_DN2138_c0_g1_i1.p1  ORF type:complete len:728 (-),score=141.43 TRINITY_DN2138_c0_g1_i1:256-2439(-)